MCKFMHYLCLMEGHMLGSQASQNFKQGKLYRKIVFKLKFLWFLLKARRREKEQKRNNKTSTK